MSRQVDVSQKTAGNAGVQWERPEEAGVLFMLVFVKRNQTSR